MRKNHVVKTPVQCVGSQASIQTEVSQSVNKFGVDFLYDDSNGPNSIRIKETPNMPGVEQNDEALDNDLVSTKFADQIKIDFINNIDYRILCRFLGVTTVNDIKNHPYQSHPLITLILMENIITFMKDSGYEMAGELNFDCNGNSIPPIKNPWSVKGKETTFTVTGFLFFEKTNGKAKDNVAFFLYSDLERGGASITSYSTDTNKSKNIINELETYSKQHNCLRGSKLKDVNMISASFSEVNVSEDFTWENYYYSDEIKDLFKLEVFDFIENVEKYNKCNITKRGLILFGRPGGGKTTIGNIVCNMAPNNTVIWITPEILSENNYKAMSSIKALYKLADFLSPCIVILEDLDLFSQDRDRGGDVLSLGALMNILDGINTISNSVTIGTTNRLKSIEGALRNRPGRFDRIIEIPSLSKDLRIKMFTKRLEGWKFDKKTLDYIIDKTEEWTGAEVQEFINSLNLKQLSSKKKSKRMTQPWAEEIMETLSSFGIGKYSSNFGFGKK